MFCTTHFEFNLFYRSNSPAFMPFIKALHSVSLKISVVFDASLESRIATAPSFWLPLRNYRA